MDINTDLNWLKHHIILLTIVIVLVGASVYGIESIIAKHDAATNSKWQVINQQNITQVQSLSDKIAANEALQAKQNAQETAIIAQLAVAISQRDKAVQVVIQKDATLSAVDAAQKIAQQTKAQPGEVVAQGDTVQLDLSVSRTVAANQDELPVVKADLSDVQKQLVSETKLYDNSQSTISDKTDLIAAMKTQEASADAACKAEIKSVKAEARKGKLKWFSIGYVLGLVSAHFAGI